MGKVWSGERVQLFKITAITVALTLEWKESVKVQNYELMEGAVERDLEPELKLWGKCGVRQRRD